ncbi:MAG: serine hydrolase domain-containing protein [Galbitalea sp.]
MSWDEVRAQLAHRVDEGILAGVAARVWHRGALVLSESLGFADIAEGRRMPENGIFQIASMTKPIVSVAALELIEEGVLSLDAPVTRWLPELAELRVLDTPTGPIDHTHPAPRQITVEDLMTHRSGFSYAFDSQGPLGPLMAEALGNVLTDPASPDEWLRAIGSLPLVRPPGETFVYGHSTEVLGVLMARIEGETLGEVLRRRVLDPLGMDDTDFWVPPAKHDRLAHLYRREPGGFVDLTAVLPARPRFEAGGGGLYSAPDDYLRFARLFLGGGEVDGIRLLRPETITAMSTNRLNPDQLTRPESTMDFFADRGFGLGLAIVDRPGIPPRVRRARSVGAGCSAPGGRLIPSTISWRSTSFRTGRHWLPPRVRRGSPRQGRFRPSSNASSMSRLNPTRFRRSAEFRAGSLHRRSLAFGIAPRIMLGGKRCGHPLFRLAGEGFAWGA